MGRKDLAHISHTATLWPSFLSPFNAFHKKRSVKREVTLREHLETWSQLWKKSGFKWKKNGRTFSPQKATLNDAFKILFWLSFSFESRAKFLYLSYRLVSLFFFPPRWRDWSTFWTQQKTNQDAIVFVCTISLGNCKGLFAVQRLAR